MKKYIRPAITAEPIELETFMLSISGVVDGAIGTKQRDNIEEWKDIDLFIMEENKEWGNRW